MRAAHQADAAVLKPTLPHDPSTLPAPTPPPISTGSPTLPSSHPLPDRYAVRSGDRLRSIGMSQNRGMNGTLSPSLGKLSSLLFLDLSNNALHGPIPDTLADLQELESLDLGGNKEPNNRHGLTGEIPASCVPRRTRARPTAPLMAYTAPMACTSAPLLRLRSGHRRPSRVRALPQH